MRYADELPPDQNPNSPVIFLPWATNEQLIDELMKRTNHQFVVYYRKDKEEYDQFISESMSEIDLFILTQMIQANLVAQLLKNQKKKKGDK